MASPNDKLLIRSGQCVNDDDIFVADIYIENGIIKEIGQNLNASNDARIIEASGHYVIPGGIDTHTHMQLPFMGTRSIDDFYSGTRAALAGGTTMIIDFAIPGHRKASLLDTYDTWRSWADQQVCCDYALHVAVIDWTEGETDRQMEVLVGERGVNSFKCFLAYSSSLMLRDCHLLPVFDTCRRIGAIAMVHAENGDAIEANTKRLLLKGVTGPEGHLQSRPEEVEAEATNRAIVLANQVNCPLYVVHVMSKSAADVIVHSRKRGCVVFGEPIAAGLGSDGTHYFDKCWRHAAAHVLSPPLRPDSSTADHLIDLLASGDLQTTGSDHCVFSSAQKALGENDFSKIPNGVNGVEERLMVLWERGVRSGKLSPSQFVTVTSANAAKIFNIYPRKGRIAVGSDADLVVWGEKPRTLGVAAHHSLVDFNIFEGMSVLFGPIFVISNGRIFLDGDVLSVSRGGGKFIPTPAFAPHVYDIIAEKQKIEPIKVCRFK